jgi:hypothetical protein
MQMTDQPKQPYQSIRIVHNFGTLQVIDARGRQVEGVIAVDMALRPGRPPIMRLNMACGAFEIEGTPVFAILDPQTKQLRPVRRIEFADGGAPFEAPDIVHAPDAGGAAPIPPGAVEITAEHAEKIRQEAEYIAAAQGIELPRPHIPDGIKE